MLIEISDEVINEIKIELLSLYILRNSSGKYREMSDFKLKIYTDLLKKLGLDFIYKDEEIREVEK